MALIRSNGGSGGSGSGCTVSIEEYNIYSTPATFNCTNAYFTVGEQDYNQGFIGSVIDGVLTIYQNTNSRYNATYSGGVLTLTRVSASQVSCYVKIAYS